MTLNAYEFEMINGETKTFGELAGKVTLVVNVASRCGLTPQYEQLEALQKKYESRGFTVVGFPCNQFMFQEPGSNEQIADYCSTTWGVTFPMMDKVKVNGRGKHPLYAALTKVKDAEGKAGNVKWNFEKFLVGRDGRVIRRYAPQDKPEGLAGDIEAALAAPVDS